MNFSSQNTDQLLETAAGHAVYDSLIQANVDPRTVSIELVKQMLVAECRHRKMVSQTEYGTAVAC